MNLNLLGAIWMLRGCYAHLFWRIKASDWLPSGSG